MKNRCHVLSCTSSPNAAGMEKHLKEEKKKKRETFKTNMQAVSALSHIFFIATSFSSTFSLITVDPLCSAVVSFFFYDTPLISSSYLSQMFWEIPYVPCQCWIFFKMVFLSPSMKITNWERRENGKKLQLNWINELFHVWGWHLTVSSGFPDLAVDSLELLTRPEFIVTVLYLPQTC